MHGELLPGQALTLRGVGKEYEMSMTPVREAMRRLVAEGALSLSSSGRITTPELSNERIEELAAIRALLEPELASRARLANSGSNSARMAASSSIRSLLSSGVVIRPDDDKDNAPSATKRRIASRTGVIDISYSLPTPRRVNAWPGNNSPCMIRVLSER